MTAASIAVPNANHTHDWVLPCAVPCLQGEEAIAITERLSDIYERLDEMDAATAPARAGV